jgi:hypothetical protein
MGLSGPAMGLLYLYQFALYKGWDIAVGIATRYGLEGSGIDSRLGRVFRHPSRPALGLNQPAI